MSVRKLIGALLVLGIAVLAAACGDDNPGPSATSRAVTATPAATATPAVSPFPVKLKDGSGNEVTLTSAPKRIVALAPSFVEVLFAIGAGGSVVAVDENSDYPPAAASLPKLSGFQPSVEGIAERQPDLVLIVYDPGGLQDALRGLHIPVLLLPSPDSLQGVYDQIKVLGRATGHRQEAASLVTTTWKGLEALQSRLAGVAQGPRVYHEVDNTYFSAGPGSFINDIYGVLWAQNIAAATGQAFPQLSAEAIIAANPEVIILADEDAGESPQTVAARPGWGEISAVKQGRVYAIDADIISRPGPRLLQAAQELAAHLYPDIFR